MAANKLKVQAFRANDLSVDTGKQFELGRSWCDFLEIDDSVGDVSLILLFKPLSKAHENLKDRQIVLQLSALTIRNDRKAYANGARSGYSAIKEFFLEDLHLTAENNIKDYFAVYKASELNYYLYYIPKLLHDNFIRLFESITPNVTIHRAFENEEYKCNTLQRIYYGAPGTGKSYEITQKTKGSKDVVRTTFHPDSDYSTFVGAYKPTMGKGKVYGAQGPLRDNGKDIEEPKIVYEFVEQAFLQAYIQAWEKYAKDHEEKQFLVIEEINRGNCAQIFGDIFQLLDRRKDGFSDYPINPDKDIRLHLKQKLEDLSLTDIPTIDNIEGNDLGAMICNGEKMLLPPNLYIWATMNTSDQSLFPIDSAFKRRWDWKYMPIDTKKECWYIIVGNNRYSWTTFLEKVNNELLTDETAEDKHLGFYFCKAENNEIATEKFVGKVLFYLWNDVFKIYGIPSAIGSSKDWGYTKFYNPDGSVNEQKVADLMKQLTIVAEGSVDGDTNGQIEEQS